MPLVEDYAPSAASVPDETTFLGAIAGCIAHEFNNRLSIMFLHIEAARESAVIHRESASFPERAIMEIRRAKRMTDELPSHDRVSPLPIESIPAGIPFPPDVSSYLQTAQHETENGVGNGWSVPGDHTRPQPAFRTLERYPQSSTSSAIAPCRTIHSGRGRSPGIRRRAVCRHPVGNGCRAYPYSEKSYNS